MLAIERYRNELFCRFYKSLHNFSAWRMSGRRIYSLIIRIERMIELKYSQPIKRIERMVELKYSQRIRRIERMTKTQKAIKRALKTN